MRARNVKPGFFENEQLAELPYEARLLFIGLWCLADREGRLEDRPKRIKMKLFPADLLDVEPLLLGLAACGLIVRYEADAIRCIFIPTFLEHQRPHVHEAPSTLPMFHVEPKAPTKVGASTDQGACDSALNPDSLNPDCLTLRVKSAPARAATETVAEAETPPAGRKRSDTATRLPADFELSSERRAVAVAERLDPDRTFATFRDYWLAASGTKARKHDWDATWRNWCRTQHDRTQGNGNGNHRPPQARVSALERVKRATEQWRDGSGGARLEHDG